MSVPIVPRVPTISPRPGAVIANKYRLLRPISSGSMGTVWAAYHRDLDVQVAIKLLRQGYDAEELAARMQSEARLSARLAHPHVVAVHDLGVTAYGAPYLVMDLLDGEDLRQCLDREKTLPVTLAVQTLLPVLDALGHAHDQGVIHRDLKPENVFLATRPNSTALWPTLLDFGIARRVQESRDRRLTAEGTVLGTVSYLSPEQARGSAAVDQRSDLWAFCCLLHECVLGRPPFDGDPPLVLLRRIAEEAPVPPSARGLQDPVLDSIIRGGLEHEPGRRWQSAEDLGRALCHWLLDRGVTEDLTGTSIATRWLRAPRRTSVSGVRNRTTQIQLRPPRRRRSGLLAAGALSIAATTAALWVGLNPAEQPPRLHAAPTVEFDVPPEPKPEPSAAKPAPAPKPRPVRPHRPAGFDPRLGF
ncbi:MAG: serine/threonine protein kinase [Polyangiaceae bacterium]|nr:serine/threonine protein kinase [Polyangiaceae bacterium]